MFLVKLYNFDTKKDKPPLICVKQVKAVGGGAYKVKIIIMKIVLHHNYEDLISIENLLLAWQEFVKGKRNKQDVQLFQFSLMDNILQLHRSS